MKKIQFLKLTMLFSLVLFQANAHANEFGFLGGVSSFSPTETFSAATGGVTGTVKSFSQTSGGIYYVRHLSPGVGLEFDALYVKRKVELSNTLPADDTLVSKVIQIPVILRFNLIPHLFNIGVGGYYEIGMSGGIDDTDNNAGTTTNQPYSYENLKHNDYGAVGSAQIKFHLGPKVMLLVDARYLYGMSEQAIDTTYVSIKNRYLQVFGGLGFSI